MFHHVYCLLLLPALVYGVHLRIQGGNAVDVLDYPYQAAFELNGRYSCGAVIISESFVLTGGNCYTKSQYYHKSVRVNTTTRHQGGTVIRVKKAHLHPDFNPEVCDYDVTVLELAEPLTFGPGIRAAALPEVGEKLPNFATLTVSGWGATEINQLRPVDHLRAANVSYYEDCAHSGRRITSRLICGYDPTYVGRGSCFGDWGDPVVHAGKVYGLVAWSDECWKEPDIYANLASREIREYIKFISGV